MKNGETSMKNICDIVRKRLNNFQEGERIAMERQLLLMISRDEDQVHDVVRH